MISNEAIDELVAGASTEEDIAGPGGSLAELTLGARGRSRTSTRSWFSTAGVREIRPPTNRAPA
jgi:hypothetical protein